MTQRFVHSVARIIVHRLMRMLKGCADAVSDSARELSGSIPKNSNAQASAGSYRADDRQTAGNAAYSDNNRNANDNMNHMGENTMNQNMNSAPTGGYGQPLKTDRGLIGYILLSIITCGIYSLYWQYSLGNRLAANAPRYGMSFQENGTTILMWQLFGVLLCGIGPFIAMNIIIKNTNAICMAYNRANGYM